MSQYELIYNQIRLEFIQTRLLQRKSCESGLSYIADRSYLTSLRRPCSSHVTAPYKLSFYYYY